MVAWGKRTVLKFLGGEAIVRVSTDPLSPPDYVKSLEGIVKRSEDMSQAYFAVAQYIMGSIDRTFKAEGRPRRWQKLADTTIADRIRKGFGPKPILVRTGLLRNSLTRMGAPQQHLRIGPRSLQFGSNVDYFLPNQMGTDTIPAREMFLLQRQDNSQISRILNTYVNTGEVTYRGSNR